MSQENVEAIRNLFKGVEKRDLEVYTATCHPEVVIREPESLPYGGEYRGLDGVERHAVSWLRTWGQLQPGDERKLSATFHDAGDTVIARWRLSARAPGTEKKLDTPMVGVYRLRDGKLIEAQMFYADTAAVLRYLDEARSTEALSDG